MLALGLTVFAAVLLALIASQLITLAFASQISKFTMRLTAQNLNSEETLELQKSLEQNFLATAERVENELRDQERAADSRGAYDLPDFLREHKN